MAHHAVTCRTEGCENADVTLILTSPGHAVICGPCGQQIIDIDPPLPEPWFDDAAEPEDVAE